MTINHDNGGDINDRVPPHRELLHYHGDSTRALFVIGALLLIVAKSTGANIPPDTTTGTVIAAVVLVIAAGITNPVQGWIHWMNALIAIYGTLLFGVTAIDRYRSGISALDSSFIYIEALALLSLIALYFTTRTVRGFIQRPELS